MAPSQSHLRQLQRIYHQQYESPPTFVPHYDVACGDLRAWYWPVNGGVRVTPTDMSRFRAKHEFKNPGCLCSEKQRKYIESAIYIPVFGPYSGKYVAGCATNTCGYLIDIERMYSLLGLSLKKFKQRHVEAFYPPPIIYSPIPGRRGVQDLFAVIMPPYESPSTASQFETPFEQLLRLDSEANPGLSEAQFRALFVKCRCGKVMTRRVFQGHVCLIALNPPTIVDLTQLSSDDTSVIDLTFL